MKKNTLLKRVSLIVGIAALGLALQFGSHKKTSQVEIEALSKQFPNEWMYTQRAYPNNFINPDAIKTAKTQVRGILNQRKSTQATGNWVLEGPINTGGRITDIEIDPTDNNTFYLATATGGIFKTTDKGITFTPIFDDTDQFSIGNIEIAPSNPNIIYAGTGEANGNANSGAFFGDGMYRSDDAGATWSHAGLPNSEHIARIQVDPTNPDRVFAAVAGKLYGTSPERGIYRTTTGGATWERVLYVTDSTAAIDVVMNPQNTNVLFAAMWERTRKPWQRDYAGLTSAIHRSTDGGNTWQELGVAHGLPAPDEQTGRIGLAISHSNPNIIYARFTTNEITNEFNGVYKSVDGGDNWALVALSELSGIDSTFGWYFGKIRVNPTNPDEVYVLGQGLSRSLDGGDNWSNAAGGMHVDHHSMEFSLSNPDFRVAGNDGGAYLSEDGGASWQKFENLPITQFYNIEVDFLQPEQLYGGTQDNNTIRTTTGSLDDYNSIWGGDGFHVNVDPTNSNIIYVESQFGNLARSLDGNTFAPATVGIGANDRNNWNTPVVLSPFNSSFVYYGTEKLYTSTLAAVWLPISPDLTDGQHPSGSLSYGTLTAIAPSYLNLNTVYTGSDDGNVNVTFDGGQSWTNISAGLPDRYVTALAISPTDDQTIYVTLSGYGELDYAPHVFKSTDGGQNWTDISGNLPNIPVNEIIMTPDEQTLFVATDLNVWYSKDDGANWDILGDNLPLTLTRDLKYHEPTETLYAGTFGRSIYSYDLTQLLNVDTPELTANTLTIYPNPVTSSFSIKHQLFTEGEVTLYTLDGRQVKTLYKGDLQEFNGKKFDVSTLESGIYFITLTNGITKQTQKLVKR